MRNCEKCGKELEDFIDICPQCGYERKISLSEQNVFAQQIMNHKKDQNGDLSLRIASEPNDSYECFKGYLKSMIVVIVLGIMVIIFGISFSFFPFLIYMMVDEEEVSSLFVMAMSGFFILIPGIALIIYGMVERSKMKKLLNNGIVVKNVPYKIIKETENTQYIEAEYIDPEGRNLVFKGKIASFVAIPQQVCDVMYDRNNPKNYRLMNDIK